MTGDNRKKSVPDHARGHLRGMGEFARDAGRFLVSPSLWPEKIRSSMRQRRDAATGIALNRQIRRQFMEAFNRSAGNKMSVEVNEIMRQYNVRNTLFSALLRPYEIFSLWNAPSKIAAAAAFYKGVKIALWPVMGAWGLAVPMAAFVGSRMALIHRDSRNRQQEALLAREGLVIPCTFEVRDQKVFVAGHEIDRDFTAGFPVMHRPGHGWVVSRYDSEKKRLERTETIHAAGFEGLRTGRLSPDDVDVVRNAFKKQEPMQNCAYVLSMLLPGLPVSDVVGQVNALAQERLEVPEPAPGKSGALKKFFNRAAGRTDRNTREISMPEAVVRAFGPFFLTGKNDTGLEPLAGKIDLENIRYLSELLAHGIALGRESASYAAQKMNDRRFSETLSFREIAELSLWPQKTAAIFEDLWKDRDFRGRFGFPAMQDMIANIDTWGGVALNLARHDYTRSLSENQIIELSMPENAYWAKIYHAMRVSRASETAGLSHDDLKNRIRQMGLAVDYSLATGRAAASASPAAM